MQYKDYYQILGVTRSATADEIKRAYRKQARRYHPDVSKASDAEERFKEVNEAYEVLKDVEKRRAYDTLGSQWRQGQEFRPPPGWEGFQFNQGGGQGGGFAGDAGAFSDFFDHLFGNRPGHRAGGGPGGFGFGGRRAPRGEDQRYRLQIELEDAYHGAVKRLNLPTTRITADGTVQRGEKTLEVKVPRGVSSGQVIRLAGQGPSGNGLQAGDVLLEISFRDHPRYQVEGRDVLMELPLAPWEAALGAQLTVSTPAGPVQLKTPVNARGGQRLRLKGKGLPAGGDAAAGDLYAVIRLVTPPADTVAITEAYQRLAEVSAFQARD